MPQRKKANVWLDLQEARLVGMEINEDDRPVFPNVVVPFVGEDSALGAMCNRVNNAIAEHFTEYELRIPVNLRSLITSGAMTAGDADQALAYLLRWVEVETGDDE